MEINKTQLNRYQTIRDTIRSITGKGKMKKIKKIRDLLDKENIII